MFPAHMMYKVICFELGSVKDQSPSSELTETFYFGGQLAKHP